MAGGKETPRQKMIGMMYLVLTALLALNVSSAILLKFQFIDESLMEVNRGTVEDNKASVQGIQKAVAEGASTAKDKVVVQNAQEVRERTAALVDYIRGLRKALVDKAGGKDPETGNYTNPEANEIVNEIFIGVGKSGKGYELEKKLNEYAAYMNTINKEVPNQLALGGSEDPIAKDNPDQRKKDFAHLTFEETPMVAALATLAQKEAVVLKHEAETLSKLAQQVGAEIQKFENIFAMASAESKTVAAGTKYQAELFLAASSDAITPTMTVDGRPIPVKDGKGQVEFIASAGNYDAEGNAKKTWTGKVKFRNQNGVDTTFTVVQEYVVAKPVMQIQSATVNSLYYECANELSIQVPALGALYDPSFSASGAQVSKGPKKGDVVIYPTGRVVKLNVSSNGNLIGTQDFTVKAVPMPQVIAYANGQPIDVKRGMPAPGPRVLEMRAVPDKSFAEMLPKEARYRVTDYTVYLVRGNRPVMNMTSNQPTINLTRMAEQARPGDRIAIEVKEVRRMDSRGNSKPVGANVQDLSLQLN